MCASEHHDDVAAAAVVAAACVCVAPLACRMGLLDVAMRKLLKNVVPADVYAARLVAVCLRPHLPRWVCLLNS
jgi:hypothetical protein